VSDPLSLFTFLSTVSKTAADLMDAKDVAERNRLLIEFQNSLIQMNSRAASLQQENHALIEQKRGLEKELGKLKDWATEKMRYELKYPWGGAGSVYALKESQSNSEAAHYLCTRCFDDSQRSILQPVMDKNVGSVLMRCSRCKTDVNTGYRAIGPAKYAGEGS